MEQLNLFNQNEVEIWKDVIDYEELYKVNNFGIVKSLPKIGRGGHLNELLLSIRHLPSGYKQYCFSVNCRSKYIAVHRIVALAFIPNPENKPEVNHIDGNKANNIVTNLEWVTISENKLHAYRILKRKTNGKQVYQYDKKNNLINTFVSVSEAHRQTGVNLAGISKCCLRWPIKSGNKYFETKSAGGYDWSYELKIKDVI